MGDSLLAAKSIDFSIRIINLNKMLKKQKQEYIISNQLLRSGTSIGANVREAKFAQSTADFISKMSIALKEANESLYWLELLNRTNYISNTEYDSIYSDCDEILRMLHSTVRTSKLKLNKSL